MIHSDTTMDLTIKGLNGVKDTVELGEDDTPAVMRRKVASAVGLPEDGFVMSFGGVAVDEGYDMTQLSAGDTVVLTKVKKQGWMRIPSICGGSVSHGKASARTTPYS